MSPSEDFTCSLGVDPAVKVTYKPIHKFREHSGLISKTVSTTYKQVIEVKNTHKDLVKIIVIDQVPLSTEEKIRVSCHYYILINVAEKVVTPFYFAEWLFRVLY